MDKIALVNKVIAELNLVVAKVMANDSNVEVKALLAQAGVDLATATAAFGGIGTGGGEDGNP